ncbi:unnamed protein product [Musa banksii]
MIGEQASLLSPSAMSSQIFLLPTFETLSPVSRSLHLPKSSSNTSKQLSDGPPCETLAVFSTSGKATLRVYLISLLLFRTRIELEPISFSQYQLEPGFWKDHFETS